MENPEEFKEQGLAAYAWVTSDESMQSARWMCKNVITTIEDTFKNWTPRPKHEFIKVDKYPVKKMVHPLTY